MRSMSSRASGRARPAITSAGSRGARRDFLSLGILEPIYQVSQAIRQRGGWSCSGGASDVARELASALLQEAPVVELPLRGRQEASVDEGFGVGEATDDAVDRAVGFGCVEAEARHAGVDP